MEKRLDETALKRKAEALDENTKKFGFVFMV